MKTTGPKKHTLTLELHDETVAYLECLADERHTVHDVIMHLIHSAEDGVRRPGSWERQWLHSAFGDIRDGGQHPDVPYYRLPLRDYR